MLEPANNVQEPWLQRGPTWIDFAPSWNRTIEDSWQNRVFMVEFENYTIDLGRMVQTNRTSLRERPVRRVLTETVPDPMMLAD
jgi:hypothetical protein